MYSLIFMLMKSEARVSEALLRLHSKKNKTNQKNGAAAFSHRLLETRTWFKT